MAASGGWLRWLRWASMAPMASMVPMFSLTWVTLMGVQEGTDVKAILVFRSWVAAIIGGCTRESGIYRCLRWVDKRKLMEHVLRECYIAVGTAGLARRLTEMLGVVWRRMVMNDVDWAAPVASMAPVTPMAAMVTIATLAAVVVQEALTWKPLWCRWWWRRVASSGAVWRLDRLTQEGTDVEVPLCPSRDECTHRSSLFDRQQTTSCFRCFVMIVNVVTVVFPWQCCGVFPT